jgi:hypothetical protein
MMKQIIFLLGLLSIGTAAFGQRAVVSGCEWFSGTDPGAGNGTALALGTPESQESLAFTVATGSLPAGQLIRVKLRCKADSLRSGATAVWGIATDRWLILSPATSTARLVTQLSYQFDNGSFTNVDVADAASVNWADLVSTTGLGNGMHRLRVRATDDLGRTGVVVDGYVVISNTTGFAARLVTQMDYRFDGGAFTSVNVADGGIVNLNELAATAGLSNGMHRLQIRALDDLGRTGPVHEGFLVISNTAGFSPRLVTQMEYRIDGGAFTAVDNADGGLVNFSQILATNALAFGLHSFDLRSVDDLGRTGPVHRAFLIVSSPFAGGGARTLVAAEYFVNADPGPGNGVSIPLPADGAYDEGQENTTTILTGLPTGLHVVGLRVRDNTGRWSAAITDSMIVGPILVIQNSGSDIVLNWQSGTDGVSQFKIYRAATVNGSYALIDSTAGQSYTDPGILNSADRRFYRVSYQTTAVSSFRLPADGSQDSPSRSESAK